MTLLILGECLPGGRLDRRRVSLALTPAWPPFSSASFWWRFRW